MFVDPSSLECFRSFNQIMAKVQVTNVTVLDNPTAFQNPFQFEITFECVEELTTGLRLQLQPEASPSPQAQRL